MSVTLGLEVDVDTRLAELWAQAFERDTPMAELMDTNGAVRATIGAFLRAAYGRGYCDALREDVEGRRGELGLAHGYRLP